MQWHPRFLCPFKRLSVCLPPPAGPSSSGSSLIRFVVSVAFFLLLLLLLVGLRHFLGRGPVTGALAIKFRSAVPLWARYVEPLDQPHKTDR